MLPCLTGLGWMWLGYQNAHKENRKLKVLYTNTDQFLNKRDYLCMLICNDVPNLILLTKIIPKAQKLQMSLALLHVPGYLMYANLSPSASNLGSSGTRRVCIYVAHHLSAYEVSLSASVVECAWVRLSLKGRECLLIGCIYRSPSSRLKDSVHQLRLLFQHRKPLFLHMWLWWETSTSYRLTGELKQHRLPTPVWNF